MLSNFERVLDRLKVASRNGNKAKAFCPAHDDRNNPSLSVKAEDGKILLHCFLGCEAEDIVAAMGLEMGDLFEDGNDREVGGVFYSPETRETVKRLPTRPHGDSEISVSKASGTPGNSRTGCTLEDYAVAKKLPVEFLRSLSLKDVTYMDLPAVRVPYPNEAGQEVAARF